VENSNGHIESKVDEKPFLILSLSGGGYRGLFTAEILRRLEEAVGSPLCEHFDLITGTSIGGILGLGVAKGIPAEKLVELLKDNGKLIFKKKPLHNLINLFSPQLTGLFGPLYSTASLRSALEADDVFGNATIGDLQTRVMIPAVNLTKGTLSMLKTPHHINFRTDWQYNLVDVALATSAAPTYFPVYEFANMRWADGGVVANDPSMQAVHEALHFVQQDLSRIRVVSIGSASAGTVLDQATSANMGKLDWASILFDITINSQSRMNSDMVGHWLPQDQYFKLDEAPQSHNAKYFALDNASDLATEALIGHATVVAQKLISPLLVNMIKLHQPTPATFYHGPNANGSNQGKQ
jgi:uncharacterized protein